MDTDTLTQLITAIVVIINIILGWFGYNKLTKTEKRVENLQAQIADKPIPHKDQMV